MVGSCNSRQKWMFVNKPSTVLVNTGIGANNTISGENIAFEPFGILKILQRGW
jgi:hypothetical protein